MTTIQQFEGTWEEILNRGGQLAGKRVRVTVLPEADQDELRRRARMLMSEADMLEVDQERPKLRGMADEFAEGISEKLRRESGHA
ncbi:MAG TPA: hypothetical protein VFC78_06480 [Tepidisphaeraceae bacterium]|nr:hypothetical protein [Tepidisphaeraceae bacterium]